jgi:6-pyruvoyltetrahydropterin/6-carboxytetrahydropterin synthase
MIGLDELKFLSTKTYTHSQGLSCCFRQWRALSHCRFLHGYALEVKITFSAVELDDNGWVQDFGGLKVIKNWLEDKFDHKTVVANDDPEMAVFSDLHNRNLIQLRVFKNVGCEAFAFHIFKFVDWWLEDEYNDRRNITLEPTRGDPKPRVRVECVEIREHGANSAIVRRRQGE